MHHANCLYFGIIKVDLRRIMWVIVGVWHITDSLITEWVIIYKTLPFHIHWCFHITHLMITDQFEQCEYGQPNWCGKWTPCTELGDAHFKIESGCVDMIFLLCEVLSSSRFTSTKSNRYQIYSVIIPHLIGKEKNIHLRWEPECHSWAPSDETESYHNCWTKCHHTR